MKSESAFPIIRESIRESGVVAKRIEYGMSLRDYAEIHFIQGMLADRRFTQSDSDTVDRAIKIADEWLKRREERKCSTDS